MAENRTHFHYHRQGAANASEKTNSGAPSLVRQGTQPSLDVTFNMDVDEESSKVDLQQEAGLEDEKIDEPKNSGAECLFNEEVDDGALSFIRRETQPLLEDTFDMGDDKESPKADRPQVQVADRQQDIEVDGFDARYSTEEGALSSLPPREVNGENIADLKDSNPHGTFVLGSIYFDLIKIHTNCSFL
jgi:hypothetical protein